MQKYSEVKIDGHLYSCFGFVNHTLYLATRHHMAIMTAMLQHGYDFDDLATARQAWGWITSSPGDRVIQYIFSTDAGMLDEGVEWEMTHALHVLTGLPVERTTAGAWGQTNTQFAPGLQNKYGPGGYWSGSELPQVLVYDVSTGQKQIWESEKAQQPQVQPQPQNVSTKPIEQTWNNAGTGQPFNIGDKVQGGKYAVETAAIQLAVIPKGALVISDSGDPNAAIWEVITPNSNGTTWLKIIEPNMNHPGLSGHEQDFPSASLFQLVHPLPIPPATSARIDKWRETPPWEL